MSPYILEQIGGRFNDQLLSRGKGVLLHEVFHCLGLVSITSTTQTGNTQQYRVYREGYPYYSNTVVSGDGCNQYRALLQANLSNIQSQNTNFDLEQIDDYIPIEDGMVWNTIISF